MHIKNFKFTLGFASSIIIAIALQKTGAFADIIAILASASYLSALIAGVALSSTFTAIPAAVFFFDLGRSLNPWAVAIIGGFGAMIGDMLMYSFLKETIVQEIKLIVGGILRPHHREWLEEATKKRVFVWAVPFLASILIASPLPDEIGLALFSTINFRPRYLSIIALLLNTLGIFGIVFWGSTS